MHPSRQGQRSWAPQSLTAWAQSPGAKGMAEMASMGIIPAGAYRNFDYVKPYVSVADGVPQAAVDLLADPQTSGGLLVALPEEQAKELLSRCQDFTQYARIVGQVLPRREKAVEIVP